MGPAHRHRSLHHRHWIAFRFPANLDCIQVSSKPKRRRDQFKSWNFQFTLEADLSSFEGVDVYELKKLPSQSTYKHEWVTVIRSVRNDALSTTELDNHGMVHPMQHVDLFGINIHFGTV